MRSRLRWPLFLAVPALLLGATLMGCQPADRTLAQENGASRTATPQASSGNGSEHGTSTGRGATTEARPISVPVQGTIAAELTAPPQVPPPVDRGPAHVVVNLEAVEVRGELAPGVEYNFWTFDGSVPGPFIRVREGDQVEIRLKNRQGNSTAHNIDLHAVNGPGGGAAVTTVLPGGEASFRWQALAPGLYVYHCAFAPVPEHIANGMYGLVLVEPEGGLPPVDREYYVMQGDFYTEGETNAKGLQPFSMTRLMKEDPAYVVFNGNTQSLTGEKALPASVGETVRIYFGNGGPNLVSSFHVIGEIFDRVYEEASISSLPREDIQTTLVPAGGATIVEFKIDVPGNYVLVDHSIGRILKGALGMISAAGAENPDIFETIVPGIGASGH